MNLSNGNDKKSKTSGVASLFGRGSASKIGKSQFSRSMGGIMERLKGLSRRDLAMVGVGLSVLVAAPVAEYMMSKPADSANMLTSGFSSRDSQSGSASLYEPGINALSQGSADGAGEVITPLSARDPSSLILGAQSDQPPMIDYTPMGGGEGAGGDSSSSSSSSSPDMDDMRDSVRDAARNGASEAVKSAGAPTVIPRMAAGFRGLGSIAGAGGTSSSGDSKRKLSAPTKSNVSAKQSTMVNPVASAGYKGVANTPKTGNKNAIEKLRAQGDAQGGYFSGANAIKSLDNANGVKISDIHGDGPGSGFGGGSMGGGEGYKGPSHGGPHDSHKHSGKCQTLACQAAEARQKKALEWEFFWKYDVPKKIAETFINALTKGAADWLVGKIFGDKNSPETMVCAQYVNDSLKPVCQKGNVIAVFSSAKEKTVDSWKHDVCNCGKWTKSEFFEMFGNQNGGNEQDNTPAGNENPSLIETQFDRYVADYDTGLKAFMGDLASVRKNSKSKKGVEYAATAVNTYTTDRQGEGIGYPFHQLFSFVSNEANNDFSENAANKELLKDVAVAMESSKSEGKEFIALLEKVNANPEKYRIAENGVTVAITDELKELISNRLNSYKEMYALYVSSQEAYISGFGDSFEVLDKYIKESAKANNDVHNEYKDRYVAYVNNLKPDANSSAKPKEVIDNFLRKIDGTATFDNAMEGKEDYIDTPVMPGLNNSTLPPGVDYAEVLVKSERILCAPNDDVAAIPANAPSAKIRTWRGMAPDFGTSLKDDAALKDKYEEAAKAIKEREKTNWKKDSPLDIDKGYLPKAPAYLSELKRAESLMQQENIRKPEFYAPGYRLAVEIPFALASSKAKLKSMDQNLKALKEKKQSIIKDLKDNLIDINGGNGGGNNNNNNGNNDNNGNNNNNNGNNNNNNGNNNNNSQQSIAPSVCADPDHCTDAEIRKLEKEARQSGKYNKGNKELNPVWNEYKNPVSGMEKVTVNPDGGATYQDYNNSRGKVHTLRNQYDQLASQLKNSANLSQAERDAIKDEMDRVYENYEQELENTNRMWKEVCVASVKQGNPKLTMNYCNGKGGAVNHNTTNTTVPKPANTTPSSTKPTTDNGQTSKSTGKVPDVLQDIILVNKPQVVPVYDAENNKITVKVCDGLLSEGFPDVCLSYADIRSGANTCFMYTEKDACNRVRNGQLKGWPQKQVDKYGKLIAKKNRKLDGTWHKVQVTATVFDYSLRHSDARNTHMDAPQPLPRLNGTADKEYGANFSSEKKMEEFIFRTNAYCAYNKNSNSWHFKKVTLTAEEGTSSNSIGGSLNVSADVLAVKVSATATYNHSKTTYNFGKEMNYSQNFAGKICK